MACRSLCLTRRNCAVEVLTAVGVVCRQWDPTLLAVLSMTSLKIAAESMGALPRCRRGFSERKWTLRLWMTGQWLWRWESKALHLHYFSSYKCLGIPFERWHEYGATDRVPRAGGSEEILITCWRGVLPLLHSPRLCTRSGHRARCGACRRNVTLTAHGSRHRVLGGFEQK